MARRRRNAERVRSHRRGGRRRRLSLAPWIVISAVSVLLLSGVSAGYAWLATSGCSGPPVQVTVLSAPNVARILDNLGRRWIETSPAVGERCASVKVVSKPASEVAQALGPEWDPRRDGPHPHVWVPDSTAWLKLASARDDAAPLIPDRQPSIARTPTVIGMPMPMAKALGWPKTELSWRQLGTELATDEQGWARWGHPEWGEFKIGMLNPVTSTAGLHALTAIADSNDDGRITDAEREPLKRLSRSMHVYEDDAATIIGELTKLDADGEEKVLPYLSAFPILEHELRAYNDTNPQVPLAAVYPTDGSADADYPYLILDVPWSSKAERSAASQFLDFVRGKEGRAVFAENHFRDPHRAAPETLTTEHGVQPEITTLPRAVLVPDSVSLTVASWVAANRPTNVLFVLDISASMDRQVRGTDSTRLGIAQQALSDVVDLLSDRAHVGLWVFGSELGDDGDHLELTSLGPLGDESRRDAVHADLDELWTTSADDAGVYDTAVAAYRQLRDSYVSNATNLVVLITDGGDDGAGAPLEDAVAELGELRNPKHPAKLMTIGYGAEADTRALESLATATGGRSYHAEYETELGSLLITALFNA